MGRLRERESEGERGRKRARWKSSEFWFSAGIDYICMAIFSSAASEESGEICLVGTRSKVPELCGMRRRRRKALAEGEKRKTKVHEVKCRALP